MQPLGPALCLARLPWTSHVTSQSMYILIAAKTLHRQGLEVGALQKFATVL